MRVNILKYVFFSIIICFFEYAQNELYTVNERNICLGRNVINFRSNRVLADADNQLNLNDFYQSTLSLANQLNEYNDYDDDKEISFLRNTIDSHIKKHQENNTLPDINSLDKKTKKVIRKLQKELEEVKKELNNKSNSEMTTKLTQEEITKTDENNSVSEDEDFNQLENEVNTLETENNQIDFSNNNFKDKQKLKKMVKGLIIRGLLIVLFSLAIALSGFINITFVIIGIGISIETIIKFYQCVKLALKVYRKPKKSKTSK
ncbi:fam-b protein [Plasmodium yoelii]|nr:fam-b protein [Plasmodium yoelii]WBY59557.1 fam-b protein [Plasmodium yoelii yoelii]VTZ80299.1 fam-b protein [Plasmodium yoelii]|eukprot:XP_731072.2 fam-b protein [Plasmodium yoelii]